MIIWGIVILVFTIVVIYPRPPRVAPKEPGVITHVGPNYIEVESYGRFLISPKEASQLQEGEHAPKEILKRGS